MAKFTDLERCPKCGRFQVYSRHDTKTGLWDIHCDCGLHTKEYKSHRLASRAWDKLVAEMQKG